MKEELFDQFYLEEFEKRFEMGWRVRIDVCTGDSCPDKE